MYPLPQVPYSQLNIHPYKASPETAKWLRQHNNSAPIVISKAATNIYSGGGVIWGCYHCHKKAALGVDFTMFNVGANPNDYYARSYPVCGECFSVDDEANGGDGFTGDVTMGETMQSATELASRMSLNDRDDSGYKRILVEADRYILAIGNHITRKYLFNFMRELLDIARMKYDELATLSNPPDLEEEPARVIALMSTWGQTKVARDNGLHSRILSYARMLRGHIIEPLMPEGVFENPEEYEVQNGDLDWYIDFLLTRLDSWRIEGPR